MGGCVSGVKCFEQCLPSAFMSALAEQEGVFIIYCVHVFVHVRSGSQRRLSLAVSRFIQDPVSVIRSRHIQLREGRVSMGDGRWPLGTELREAEERNDGRKLRCADWAWDVSVAAGH